MDHKKSPNRRQKRQSKVLEDNYWDCSVCTYRNTAEAFKCLMCDVRKGLCAQFPKTTLLFLSLYLTLATLYSEILLCLCAFFFIMSEWNFQV